MVCIAEKSQSRAAEAAGETTGPRHGNHQLGIASLPGAQSCRTFRRNPPLLAPDVHPGLRPVPPGTALYARSGARLPRQADGAVARGPIDALRNRGGKGAQADVALTTARVFIGSGACALPYCARPWQSPDG